MKTLIIYHRSDWDGKASKIIAQKYVPDAETLGWDYGDPTPDVSQYDKIYCVDISLDTLFKDPNVVARTVWVDHHKTSIADYGHLPFLSKYLIDGVAACRLTWNYFSGDNETRTLEDFRERRVLEPNIIRWLGEHDIWDHRYPEAKIANAGMDVLGEEWLEEYLSLNPFEFLYDVQEHEKLLINVGQAALKTKEVLYSEISKTATKLNDWNGYNWWVINSALKGSGQFDSLDKGDGRDCMLKWGLTPKGIEVSLYTDNKSKDLSVIAKKYDGGGHPGACGFIIKAVGLDQFFRILTK